jgi:hypothetical protein
MHLSQQLPQSILNVPCLETQMAIRIPSGAAGNVDDASNFRKPGPPAVVLGEIVQPLKQQLCHFLIIQAGMGVGAAART